MSIPVFYSTKMVADSESASPSAAKPAQVVASWQRQFDVKIIEPAPVSLPEFFRAHDRQFVFDVLASKRNNGFGNKSVAVAASLPFTSGSLLSAARHVMANGGAAAAPCSGFHHAGYESVEGYCTFNGLMVTAHALKAEGAERVGILDLDMHYGNGTDDIIERTGAAGWVTHFTGGKDFKHAVQAPHFLAEMLPFVLGTMADCDVILYQAGADPHIDDPNGGWLTTEQLRQRDEHVFHMLATVGKPIAWNLAGGYQVEEDGSIPKVLEIHDNTMRECARAYG